MDADVYLFFAGRPRALELYEALLARLEERSGPARERVRRTQVSLYDRRVFACVSLPRRKADGGLVLSVGLPYKLEEDRVFAAAEGYPGRWTNHIALSGPDDLDEGLLALLDEARAFADSKR